MKRDVLSITYFIDPQHKRYVQIPVWRIGVLMVSFLAISIWGVYSALLLLPDSILKLSNTSYDSIQTSKTENQKVMIQNPESIVSQGEDTPKEVTPSLAEKIKSDLQTLLDISTNVDQEMRVSDIHPNETIAIKSNENKDKQSPVVDQIKEQSAIKPTLPIAEYLMNEEQTSEAKNDPISAQPALPAISSESDSLPATTSALGIKVGGVSTKSEGKKLKIELSLLNANGASHLASGSLTGTALFYRENGEVIPVKALNQLQYAARHSISKVLEFERPFTDGQFQSAELMIRNNVNGEILKFVRKL